ncbi:hypothetical protein PLESTF_000818800 [Pleodorina starrii]|nr:hypothetical protein PLESTF_000818800 [Pleodorina starrii]
MDHFFLPPSLFLTAGSDKAGSDYFAPQARSWILGPRISTAKPPASKPAAPTPAGGPIRITTRMSRQRGRSGGFSHAVAACVWVRLPQAGSPEMHRLLLPRGPPRVPCGSLS